MDKNGTRLLQEETILHDLLLSLEETVEDFNFKSSEFPLEFGVFSFSNYSKKDLLVINQNFKNTQLHITFEDWFLNDEIITSKIESYHDSESEVIIGKLSIATIKQGISKIKIRLKEIEKWENQTNVNIITLFCNKNSQVPERWSINNEKEYKIRKGDNMLKFFKLYKERSIFEVKKDTLKKFLKPLADTDGTPTNKGYFHTDKLFIIEEISGGFKLILANPKIVTLK